jgi:fructokinase
MILCCGESLIDMIPAETVSGGVAYAPHAGGAVFNTAIALGRLGAPSGMLTGMSEDLFGELLRDSLKASKVDYNFSIISRRPTTLAFVKLTNGQAKYTFYDENSAGRMIEPSQLPVLDASIKAAFFGGISLAQEPCGSTYEALMAREAASRAVMVDPNVRPGFAASEKTYRDRVERMVGMADIVKLSDEDLAWLEGEGGIDGKARAICARGPALVVITRGSEGATGYTREHTVSVKARRTKVADTVGAGDTFNAGVMAGLHEQGLLEKGAIRNLDQKAIEHALNLGAAAAAVTVSRSGANPPWRNELT